MNSWFPAFPEWRNINFDTLKLPLSPSTQSHVRAVYFQIGTMLTLSAVGVWMDMYRVLGLSGGTLSFIATLGTLLAFTFTPAIPANTQLRRNLLYAFALFKGLSLGPLLTSVSYYQGNGIIFAALGGAALIFGCFSLSALYSRDRSTIYSTGFLASALSSLFWLSIVNVFVQSSSLFSLELYLGLGVFSVFVMYDTQVMIARAEMGSKDVLKHALELYTDLVSLFVRILIILSRKEEAKKKREKREKRP